MEFSYDLGWGGGLFLVARERKRGKKGSHQCGETTESDENGLNVRNWLRFLGRRESCHQ